MIRVLVADDHPVVRAGIVALVQAADDIEVVGQAGDGVEAVRLALELSPDVVLMDLRMPLLEGDEATAQIVASGRRSRVIVLTTYESDDAILRAIEAGASGYLLKAAPEDELLAGVRSVARGEVALAPSIAALLVRRVAGAGGAAGAGGTAGGTGGASPVALTDRETQVLALVAQGRSNREAGAELFVSEATVKTHLLHAFEKLGVSDRTRAVTRAMELGLLPLAR
ncbi:response regulator transcription factor [Frondihabitans australicus]|uniref:LuxR family two component transcriptional regulator n=1 Tax=Frondihabitans australicus TaxID=386892 RepID=A0A495IKI6_9MICO|nr:response regulator transcription factor [Frondihabitans australicus]RKR75635.1 LuxR family two component transcriptional regulator [Frondihabitans australicus]